VVRGYRRPSGSAEPAPHRVVQPLRPRSPGICDP
jgi:hypothetical protein